MSINLFCLVEEDLLATTRAFLVEINKDETIGELKDAIKLEYFVDVSADKLQLWKVDIDISDSCNNDQLSNLSLQDQDQLLATEKISKYFPDLPAKECIHVIVKLPLLSLEEALSYVTPPIVYRPEATSSTSTMTVNCSNLQAEMLLWSTFFEEVNQFSFDKEPKFKKPPHFQIYSNVVDEEEVRYAFNSNICLVLNELLPDYQFSRRSTHTPGISAFNCYYSLETLVLTIEVEISHALSNIGGQTFPDFYKSDLTAKMVIWQIYNYMCQNQLQYGVLTTYDNHWFLHRSDKTPSKLSISPTLSSQSKSPTVLEAYAYIIMQARASIPSPVDKNSDIITEQTNTHVTRSMASISETSESQQNQQNQQNPQNQQNLNFTDFEFNSVLGHGRSGKTLLCKFRGDDIALKTADLYKTPAKILKEMQNEVKIYKDLEDIQGIYIPKLVCYGYYGGGWCYVLGTTLIGGTTLGDTTIKEQQRVKALEALRAIHKHGILHNDIREDNILIGDNDNDVYLIDFGMSSNIDLKEQWNLVTKEESKLDRLLEFHLNKLQME
ncbi:hypothetical protein Glove_57g125 [Diversispora epigaea]|uniref:Protein kinase domain-containing protein n=1 Tax=Diversispora epigaea TaxID=1348612 RepID=A0A397JCB1_9GLOM|nr:hypothetical protein Glove_57g125 [Diversispora epigaea]